MEAGPGASRAPQVSVAHSSLACAPAPDKGPENRSSELVGPSLNDGARSVSYLVSLAFAGVGAGGCDAQDAVDGVGGASRVRAHRRTPASMGARGHCAEGEDGQGPAVRLGVGGGWLREEEGWAPAIGPKQRHSPTPAWCAERRGWGRAKHASP